MLARYCAPSCTNKEGYYCITFEQRNEIEKNGIMLSDFLIGRNSKSADCEINIESCVQMFHNITPVNTNENNINVIISHSISIY